MRLYILYESMCACILISLVFKKIPSYLNLHMSQPVQNVPFVLVQQRILHESSLVVMSIQKLTNPKKLTNMKATNNTPNSFYNKCMLKGGSYFS